MMGDAASFFRHRAVFRLEGGFSFRNHYLKGGIFVSLKRSHMNFYSMVVLVSLLLILGGCLTPPVVPLKSDKINDKGGFQSVIVWSVLVEDKTNKFSTVPQFAIRQVIGEQEKQGELTTTTIPYPPAPKGNYTMRDGVSVLNKTFFAEAKPGEYEIDLVTFEVDSSTLSTPYDTKTTVTFLRIPLNLTFTVPAGKLVYPGVIKIEILSGGSEGYKYNIGISQDDTLRLDALKLMYQTHPFLYDRFSGNVVAPVWRNP